jgi:hypothetical protein
MPPRHHHSPPKLRWWVILLASFVVVGVATAVDVHGTLLRTGNLYWMNERPPERFAFAWYNAFIFGVIIGAIFDLVRWWEWKRRA